MDFADWATKRPRKQAGVHRPRGNLAESAGGRLNLFEEPTAWNHQSGPSRPHSQARPVTYPFVANITTTCPAPGRQPSRRAVNRRVPIGLDNFRNRARTHVQSATQSGDTRSPAGKWKYGFRIRADVPPTGTLVSEDVYSQKSDLYYLQWGARMKRSIDRRDFLKTAALGAGLAGALPAPGQRRRNIKIGHTGITWVQPPPPRPTAADGAPPPGRGRGGGPPRVDPAYIETIFKDISGLGFYGLELFTYQVQGMESSGGIASLIEKYNLAG